MPRDIPDWLLKEREAKAARMAALSPEERAARKAYHIKRMADRSQRRAERVKIALFINQRAMHGDKPEDIAKELGVTVGSLRSRRWGHALLERKGFRRLPAWVCDGDVAELDDLAKDLGLSREKAFSLLIKVVLQDNGYIARRTLCLRQKKAEAVA